MSSRELLCRCSCNIYACWPSVTVTNDAAVQTCLLVECCCKVDSCWTVAIHPADFFPHIDSIKVCTLIKHSDTKFLVISSVQFTQTFITSFFEGMFSQRRIFCENNMILWYYRIRSKVVWKVHCAWIDGYDSQNKDKNITITKNKSVS